MKMPIPVFMRWAFRMAGRPLRRSDVVNLDEYDLLFGRTETGLASQESTEEIRPDDDPHDDLPPDQLGKSYRE
jgi:hypothetical protein